MANANGVSPVAQFGPHLSHADFASNEALLLLSLLAFNLVSALRIEYEGAAGSCLDLACFQREVLKAGGRVVKRARRLVLRRLDHRAVGFEQRFSQELGRLF